MLQALNTGHEGSLVTVHANSPDDAIHRLETLATMSELHIPFEALRDQINSAIHVIVQIDRFADGKRRIAEVAIVASTRRETFRLGTVARFEADPIGPDRRVTGRFRHFPLPPAIHRRLELMGLDDPARVRPRGRPRADARAKGQLVDKDTLALILLLGVMVLALIGATLWVGGSNRRAALAARGREERGGSAYRGGARALRHARCGARVGAEARAVAARVGRPAVAGRRDRDRGGRRRCC